MEINTSANKKYNELHPSDKGLLKITKVPFGEWRSITLDNETSWVNTIQEEICAHYEIDPSEKGQITIELDVLRKKDFEIGEHLLINANLDISYKASCIRCLELFKEEVAPELNLVIADESLSKREDYTDVTELFLEEEERELYFYKRGQIDLNALFRELVLLELNPLPLHDAECKGLCFECGVNLNYEQCSHAPKI